MGAHLHHGRETCVSRSSPPGLKESQLGLEFAVFLRAMEFLVTTCFWTPGSGAAWPLADVACWGWSQEGEGEGGTSQEGPTAQP